MSEIKVGFIAAYDYELLKYSIPSLYEHVDRIVIAIDKDRLTFSGKAFFIQDHFFEWLAAFDRDKKISVYEDSFYIPDKSPKEIETRKRNLLAQQMGEGGWHIQVDADEYFPDFKRFKDDLSYIGERQKSKKITFRIFLCTIFKVADGGYYIVDDSFESFPLATNNPHYRENRYNFTEKTITLNHVVLHQSFGRTEEELVTKFKNWGHRDDFDSDAYLRFWKSVNLDTYRYIQDFHPTNPGMWKRLKFIQADSISELLLKTPSQYNIKSSHPLLQKWLPPVVYNRIQRMF